MEPFLRVLISLTNENFKKCRSAVPLAPPSTLDQSTIVHCARNRNTQLSFFPSSLPLILSVFYSSTLVGVLIVLHGTERNEKTVTKGSAIAERGEVG